MIKSCEFFIWFNPQELTAASMVVFYCHKTTWRYLERTNIDSVFLFFLHHQKHEAVPGSLRENWYFTMIFFSPSLSIRNEVQLWNAGFLIINNDHQQWSSTMSKHRHLTYIFQCNIGDLSNTYWLQHADINGSTSLGKPEYKLILCRYHSEDQVNTVWLSGYPWQLESTESYTFSAFFLTSQR